MFWYHCSWQCNKNVRPQGPSSLILIRASYQNKYKFWDNGGDWMKEEPRLGAPLQSRRLKDINPGRGHHHVTAWGTRRRDLERRSRLHVSNPVKPEGVRCTAGRPSGLQMTLAGHASRLQRRVSEWTEAQDPHEELSQVIITRTIILQVVAC